MHFKIIANAPHCAASASAAAFIEAWKISWSLGEEVRVPEGGSERLVGTFEPLKMG